MMNDDANEQFKDIRMGPDGSIELTMEPGHGLKQRDVRTTRVYATGCGSGTAYTPEGPLRVLFIDVYDHKGPLRIAFVNGRESVGSIIAALQRALVVWDEAGSTHE